MACRYTYKGKTYEAHEFIDVLKAMRGHDVDRFIGKIQQVPRAPFVTKTEQWTALVLKRAIRYAADHGFERVAWTTGDQQNERYSLEKHISIIDYQHVPSDHTVSIHVRNAGGEPVIGVPSRMTVGEIKEWFGADIADTIDKGPLVGQLKGLQLKTGGEAMRAYYDRMVPNIANDLLKKFGGGRVVKVQIAQLKAPDVNAMSDEEMNQMQWGGAEQRMYDKAWEQPGFDITQAMSDTAIQGLPLFQLRDEKGRGEVYGIRDGRVLGMATRAFDKGVWNVFIANGTNETLFQQGQFRRAQAASIGEVQRLFNAAGLELRINKPRNIPIPSTSIFDRNWVAPQADNWIRRSIIYFQNRLLLPELYERTIAKEVGPIPDVAKAHREARLAHPRAAGKIADFDHDYSEPIVELMKRHQLSMAQVGAYLYARHAPERNAAIEEINPENKAGSGMTTERAAEIMAGLQKLEPARLAGLQEIGALADKVNAFSEKVLIDKGLAPREAILLLQKKYEHYVPLKDLPDDDEARGETGSGFKVNKTLKSAFGRFTEAQAEFVLPGLIAQAKGRIAAGENAEVLRAFLRLVEYAPNPKAWTIKREDYKPMIDRDTGMVKWAPRRPDSRNVISVPLEGKRVLIEVHDERIAKALNESGLQLHDALGFIGTVTRFYANMATSANPAFIFTNMLRDVQEAAIRVGGEQQSAKIVAKMARDFAPAFWGAYSGLRAKGQYVPGESAKPGAEAWHAWYRRYIEAGGHIAYRGIQDAESQHKDFLVRLADAGIYPEAAEGIDGAKLRAHRIATKTGGKWMVGFVSDLNGAVENATRLAVFKNMVELGMSDKDAAMTSRNATVDFNLKGEAGSVFNALYMFFNANAQGIALLFRSVANHRGVQALALLMLAMGFFLDWWNRHASDKDETGRLHYDNIGEDIKSRNWILMGPDRKNAIMIPLPFGFGMFHNVGRHLHSIIPQEQGGGGEGLLEAGANTFSAIVNANSPFGNIAHSAVGMLQTLSFTVTDPFVQHATNRNWMDKPIHPELKFTKQSAAATYFPGTPQPYITVAEWLNEATGGNEVRSGWADIYPNTLQHWVNSTFGSAGKFYAQMANLVGAKVTGKDIETREIPIVRNFYYEPKDFELGQRFYKHINEAEVSWNEVRRAQQSGDGEKANALLQEHAKERMMYREAEAAEIQIGRLHSQMAQVRRSKVTSDEDKKLRLERLQEQSRTIMQRFIVNFERQTQ